MRRPSPACLCGLFFLTLGATAQAATLGFTQDFNDGDGGFSGGSQSYTVVLSGGVGGGQDGYLELANRDFQGQLGTRTLASEFTGDLTADGVTGLSFWLNDVGGADALEIHVGIGEALFNFWLSVDGFVPPENDWAEFSVDLTDASAWVQIMGSGTFEAALQRSDRLLFRHDLAVFGHFPDMTQGGIGIDRITVVPEPATLCLLAGCTLIIAKRRMLYSRPRYRGTKGQGLPNSANGSQLNTDN